MPTIRIQNLTKRHGPVLAVDDLSFDVRPGQVTGFLGPNGSGKTTTLRILLGLAKPTAGTAVIGGLAYHQLPDPVRQVGATLDGNSFHPGRSAAQHLLAIGSVIIDAMVAGQHGTPRLGTDAAVYQMLKFGAITCVVMLIAGYAIVLLLAASRTTIRRDVG